LPDLKSAYVLGFVGRVTNGKALLMESTGSECVLDPGLGCVLDPPRGLPGPPIDSLTKKERSRRNIGNLLEYLLLL